MSYALLPRTDDIVDPESGSLKRSRTSAGLPSSPPFSNTRSLIRTPKLKLILSSIILTLLGLSVYKYSPVSRHREFLPQSSRRDDSDLWSSTYRIGPQLPFIQEDGKPAPLKSGATLARWPQDYPEAASYIHDNSIIRDVTDPWPEKPWIASIWLAPERFPMGLHGQPYEEKPLPEFGKEKGVKPVSSLYCTVLRLVYAPRLTSMSFVFPIYLASRLVFMIHHCHNFQPPSCLLRQ
jgi:hypothetical protein